MKLKQVTIVYSETFKWCYISHHYGCGTCFNNKKEIIDRINGMSWARYLNDNWCISELIY